MVEQVVDTNEYASFHILPDFFVDGGSVTWVGIPRRDHERILGEVRSHADGYKVLGYIVRLAVAPDNTGAELRVKFSAGMRRTLAKTNALTEITKGALSATAIKAGWGGPG